MTAGRLICFDSRRYDFTRTVDDLGLSFEFDGNSMFDDYLIPEDISHEEAFDDWLEKRYYHTEEDEFYGMVPILWAVVGYGTHDEAPLFRSVPLFNGDFLGDFCWPTYEDTGEPIDFRVLPVHARRPWITEHTGWTPAPLTPFVHVNTLAGYEYLERLPYENRAKDGPHELVDIPELARTTAESYMNATKENR